MKKKSTILILLLSLILILPIPTQSHANALDIQYVEDLIDYAQEHYLEEISRQKYLENALKGVLGNLDDYSKYYNREEFEEMNKSIDGNFVGIGVYITEEDGHIVITDSIDNSPAKKAGLKSGDIIWNISGKSAQGITSQKAVEWIKGERGTNVRIIIKRGSKKFTVILKRDKVVIIPVKYEIMDNIGYIKLEQFSQDSYKYMKEALDHMDENEIEDIILDLRDNPGGYLNKAIDIGNKFIKKGPITHVKYRDESVTTYPSYLEEIKYNLVLLVNENSASASELLAAAIKETESGTIIGKKTFGKGTVQEIHYLTRGDGIKLTIAEYFSPKMNKINGLGVIPHIEVENKPGEDNQLEKALSLFTNP